MWRRIHEDHRSAEGIRPQFAELYKYLMADVIDVDPPGKLQRAQDDKLNAHL